MPIKPEDAKITGVKAYAWFKEARDAHSDARKDAIKDNDYYDPGGQWSKEDKQELKNRGQPAIEYNLIKSTTDLVLGTEKRMRVDYKALARTGAHVEDADVVTNLLKHAMDQCGGEYVLSEAFEKQVKAWGWVEVVKNKDPFGEPVALQGEDREFVFWDPLAKDYDVNDGKYLGRTKWLDLEDAQAMFPKYKEELQAAIESDLGEGFRKQPYEQTGDDVDPHGSVFDWEADNISTADWIDKGRKRVRLLEIQYKVPVDILILVNNATGEKEEFHLNDTEAIMKLMDDNVEVRKASIKKVRIAIIAGPNVIQDKWSPWTHNRYTLVPFWCFRKDRTREPYGFIRERRDPQDEVNKRRSKALHILNAAQVISPKGAVEDIEEGRSEVARADCWLEWDSEKTGGIPVEIKRDTQLADAQFIMLQDAKEMILSGPVNREQMAMQSTAKSGKQEQIRINQANTQLATIFDNYRRSRLLVGELLWSGIQQYYTIPMEIRVTDQSPSGQFVTINERYEDDEGKGYIRNDISKAKVDIKIDEDAYHASMREAMLEYMMDLATKLPPEVSLLLLDTILSYSNVPGREELVAKIKMLQQRVLGMGQGTAEAGGATA